MIKQKIFCGIGIGILHFIMCGCIDSPQEVRENPAPLPPLSRSDSNIQDSLIIFAKEELNNGIYYCIFQDTITDIKKLNILYKVFDNNIRIRYYKLYDVNTPDIAAFKRILQPIMDSAIAAKYGANAKDSIINEAYRLTEIEYKKNR